MLEYPPGIRRKILVLEVSTCDGAAAGKSLDEEARQVFQPTESFTGMCLQICVGEPREKNGRATGEAEEILFRSAYAIPIASTDFALPLCDRRGTKKRVLAGYGAGSSGQSAAAADMVAARLTAIAYAAWRRRATTRPRCQTGLDFSLAFI